MVNLEKIKADIAARKNMPVWGPDTSIERIKTINATLPSFSLETVEALVTRIDDLENDEIRLRLANAEFQLEMAGNAKHNLKASRKAQFHKRKEAEARLAEMESLIGTSAIKDVIGERQRQKTTKGYSHEQDDTYIEGELAAAAISYIEPMEAMNYWPADWHDDSFKPSDYRRNLVKAAALLIAEIERYDRGADIQDIGRSYDAN